MVEEIEPIAFCLENVPGLLEARYQPIRETVFAKLRNAGYRILGESVAVNALDFGVPQNRKRVLAYGIRDFDPPALVSFVSTSTTVGDAFEGLAEPSQYEILRDQDWVRLAPSDTKLRRQTKNQYARYLSGIDPDPSDKSRPRSWSRLHLTNSLLTRHALETMVRFAKTKPGTEERVSHYFRLSMAGSSRTLRAGTGRERGAFTSPRPIHPIHPRVITAREAARLHSFPDWFRFNVTNWHGHRQIGNSVPPLLARAVASTLSTALGHAPARPTRLLAAQDASLLSLAMGDAKGIVMAELPPRRSSTSLKPEALGSIRSVTA